jgi:hypothetical protein
MFTCRDITDAQVSATCTDVSHRFYLRKLSFLSVINRGHHQSVHTSDVKTYLHILKTGTFKPERGKILFCLRKKKQLLLKFWFMKEANGLYCRPNEFSWHRPPYLKPINMPFNLMSTSSKGFLPSRYFNQNSDCMSDLSYNGYPTHLILLNLLWYCWTE